MSENKYKYYLSDLGALVKEKALNAKKEKVKTQESDDYNYSLGYLTAWMEVVSLLKDQAEAFEIEYTELGLDDIEPESDLM